MPTIDQTPAVVHVKIHKDDAWSAAFDFSLDLTGYTIAATLLPEDGSDAIVLAIAETDLAAGQFSVSLSEAQSATLPAGYHKWHVAMSLDAAARTYVCGKFIVEDC